MTDVIVGVDAGTSVIKAVAFATDGSQRAVAARPNHYDRRPDGGCEQGLDRTWVTTVAVLRQLTDLLRQQSDRIRAIAVTGQGDGTWLIDADGAPLAPGWIWLDARAAALVERYRAGEDDHRRFLLTGSGLNACHQGAQMAYMEQTTPELLDRAATAFHCKDWLYFKLTGRRATDPSEGVVSFGDYRARAYSDEVIDLLGLSRRRALLPEIVDGTRHQDTLSDAAAAAVGATAGTPVVLGNMDAICAALGTGLYEPGTATGVTVFGSTGLHSALAANADAVALNDDRTGYTMCFPVPGHYAQIQSNMAATLNIDWLLDLAIQVLADQDIPRGRDDLIAGLDDLVLAVPPGRIIYLPYISSSGERGPFINPQARAGFIGLDAGHGFGDLMRSVFEGLALAARDCYGAMGGTPREIRLSGGGARSVALRRILGAALNAPIRIGAREEAGAAGAAMMAAVGLGIYPDMAACVADWVTPWLADAEPPDPAWAAHYDKLYPAYTVAHRAMVPVWRSLAEMRSADGD